MKYILSILNFTLIISTIGQVQDSTLFKLSKNVNLEFGSAFYYRNGWDETEYENHFLENFNHLTPEGGLVWGEYGVSPDSGQINTWGGDRIIGFAHEHGLQVKAQHLVWHRYFAGEDNLLPDWIISDEGVSKYDKDKLVVLLKNFITQTITHYAVNFPGTVNRWCVVNEAGSNTTGFIPNLWLDSLGPEYIDSSFIWAREAAGSDIKLYYNEYFYHGGTYGGARIQSKIDFAFEVISGLMERDIPIDGVGFQCHIPEIGYPGKEIVASDMKRFTDLNLEVYITELDVELISPVTQEKLIQQAKIYKEIIEIALENPLIKLVCLWQFNDAQSWLGENAEACIMDESYRPKPAYDSIQKVLIDANDLSTKTNINIENNEFILISNKTISILQPEQGVLLIQNVNGQIVNCVKVFKGDIIPTNHLGNGAYIVTFQNNKCIWQKKFTNL